MTDKKRRSGPQRPSTGVRRQGTSRVGESSRHTSLQSRTSQSRSTASRSRSQGRTTNRMRKRRPLWQRFLISTGAWALTALLAVTAVAVLGLTIAYQRLDVLTPDDFAQAQSSTFYYDDGERVIGRLGVANREVVALEDLPDHVGQVFVAAEDRTFYTNPGVDVVSTARALFNTVVLGKRQGGSTITQQYVERYYVGETVTDIPGKITEALQALKIDRQEEKDQILENYINTVYFGRGAYGVQAAAREYFAKDAADLTVAEAALLAGLLPAPSRLDPRISPDQAEFRWNYVLDGMEELAWLDPVARQTMSFPEAITYQNDNVFGGSNGYLLQAAIEEVEAVTGLTREQIDAGGYSIITTIDRNAQQAGRAAVDRVPDGADPNLRIAAVAIDASSGAIIMMYGGDDYLAVQRNAVTQDIAQAGSTFKPFALVAALEQGIALESEYDGDSGLDIEGFTRPVRNFAGRDFGQIDLTDAMANSVNTVFAQLGADVGPAAVREAAIRLGIPEDTAGLEDNPANVLGTASPHPIDLARAYATLATGGVRVEPYLVAEVLRPDGSVVYSANPSRTRVLRSDVSAEVTYAMQQVVTRGTGRYASQLGRPIAAKSGTETDVKASWFVGFAPQVVGGVTVYQVAEDGSPESITPFGGFSTITGGTIPARVWTWMMGPILEAYPVEAFPSRTFVGEAIIPSPSPEPSPSPSPSPSPEPSPSPSTDPSSAPSESPPPPGDAGGTDSSG